MTYRATISFDEEIWNLLKNSKNRSRTVNIAIKQFFKNLQINKKEITENGYTLEEEAEILQAYEDFKKNPTNFISHNEMFS